MFLDMLKLRRLPKRRHFPIQLPQPLVQGWVPRPDIPNVALEVLHVHRIEPDNRGEEPHIRLGDLVAEVVGLCRFLQVGFGAVEGGEEGSDGGFVRGLRGCEAGFVDAVVDVVVGPFVCCLYFFLEGGGKEVEVGLWAGEEVVEFGIEHADDFGRLWEDTFSAW